jgi:NhaA family Na+:H+ antiporter
MAAAPAHAQPAPPSANVDILASIVLLAAAVAALIFANSPLAPLYKAFLDAPVSVGIGPWELANPAKVWIKDALMAIFFLLIGLEIKAEFKEGSLSDPRRAILPFAGAAGGMAMPALIYVLIVMGQPELIKGWAIPSATDIAFAVGVVGLLGPKLVPPALKAFLLAVAVIDDLGAILIIAFFYTASLSMLWLGIVAVICGVLAVMNLMRMKSLLLFIVVGIALWIALNMSGVSATLSGVIVGLFVPLKAKDGSSPLHELAHGHKLPVLFVIMPVFAFANAGVPLLGLTLADFLSPVTLGIALGLFVGKPVGITAVSYLAVKSGLAKMPEGSSWLQMVACGCIAGIGFTMSLFIGILAFGTGEELNGVRLGVLSGSLASAILGIVLFKMSAKEASAKAALKPAE